LPAVSLRKLDVLIQNPMEELDDEAKNFTSRGDPGKLYNNKKVTG
jgi:hypothetical protein